MSKSNQLKAFRAAFPHTVPIMAAYLVLSFAYGIIMQSKGYNPVLAVALSALVYGGSLQYAAVDLFTTGFDPLSALLLGLSVNARYLFCSVGMLSRFADTGKVRPFLFFALSDESFAVAATVDPPQGVKSGAFYFWVCMLDYLYWVVGTLLGGLFGAMVKLDTAGLDFTLTAMYIAIFVDLLRDRRSRICGLIGALCTTAALLIFGRDGLVAPALVMILAVLIPLRRVEL